MALEIATDSPLNADVRALLEAHLTFAHTETPAGHVHALDPDALLDPAVTFFSAREDGVLLGIGALKALDDAHGELKSMHTRDVARQRGVGRAMVRHLLAVAADRGYRRVSLETGAMDVFALTSRSEGMPQAVLEASIGELPVVASRVGGLPEVIDHGKTGLLFEPGNEAALLECLRNTQCVAINDAVAVARKFRSHRLRGQSNCLVE